MKVVKGERGLALVVTLLITAILVAVITEIVYSVHISAAITESFRDGQRAGMLAQGGVELAAMAIKTITKGKNYTAFREAEAEMAIPVDDGTLSLMVVDEGGKFNINSIVYSNGETNPENYAMYGRLLKILGLKGGLSDTIADWIDINDEPRLEGGESYDYYKRLSPSYSSKNAPLYSVEEILLVKGYTPAIYKGLKRFITVYNDEPIGMNTTFKININTAPKEVIMALATEITEEMAERVMDFRDKNPFKDTADIRKVVGFETLGFDLQDRITVKSNVFRVYSKGEVGGGLREAEAVINLNGEYRVLYWRER